MAAAPDWNRMANAGRNACMTSDLLQRDRAIGDFLSHEGLHHARRISLGQDASTRRYFRLERDEGSTLILMDAPLIEPPPCPPDASDEERRKLGWNAMTRLAASRVDAFVLIAGHLRGLGIGAPKIYAHDSGEGFALMEDLGTGREFARLIERGEQDEVRLYTAAAETLAALHVHPVPHILEADGEAWPLLDFDRLALQSNADLYADWLPVEAGGLALSGAARAQWERERDALIEHALSFPRSFTLRDFHAENLIWRKGAKGGVTVLDFQDAVRGWDAWDMAMLTQDSRRAVSEAAREAAIARYLDLTGKDRSAFDERLAVIGALNALRIAGVFSRLQHRDGKPRYGNFQPRQLSILARNLAHPALKDMAAFVRKTTPFVFEAAP
jgi:N-acetylmuramate 1-kinase